MKRSASLLLAAILCGTLLSACKNDDVQTGANLPGVVTDPTSPTVVYKTDDTTVPEQISLPDIESTKRTARTDDMPSAATTTPALPTEFTEGEISVIPDIPNIPIGQFTTTQATYPVPSGTTRGTSTYGTTTSSGTPYLPDEEIIDDDDDLLYEDNGEEPVEVVDDDVVYEDGYDPKYYDKGLLDPVYRPYAYKSLKTKDKSVYDAILDAVSRKSAYVEFYGVDSVTSTDYCDIYSLVYNDEDALFYLDTKMQYAINQNTQEVKSATIFYKYSTSEIQRMQAQVDAEVDNILSRISPNMTNYEIVKTFYDYLAENVVYDEDAPNHSNIYGVFVDKRAICGGYSKAFSYLCDRVGIDTLTITGDADNVPHMWNMVKLDGAWYHIDITYAVTDSKLGSYVRYDYLCVNDDVISRSRVIYDQDYTYPKASLTTYNYYVRNKLVVNSYDEAYDMLYSSIIKASSTKSLVAEILCGSKEAYDQISYELFNRKKALDLMDDALAHSANKFKTDNISYASDENTYVIKLFLEYTN